MKRFFLTLLAFLPALLLSAQTEPPARGTHQLGSPIFDTTGVMQAP